MRDFPAESAGASLESSFLTEGRMQGMLEVFPEIARGNDVPLAIKEIGLSRGGRIMYGLIIGTGPHKVSITAGAHADEPLGPITASIVASWLLAGGRRDLTETFTFYICPQVNPDGSAANESWFSDPLDLLRYIKHVQREAPGDDIEFGYPGNGLPALRPENEAIATFLREGGPYVYHASLHGMAVAEGAWYLIGKEWVERTRTLRTRLAQITARAELGLHDIERHGDKGFTRIAPGFCTTPTSSGMREHFLKKGDETTAARFHLSSMEFVQSLGGDPLVMVSELPLFLVGNAEERRTEEAPAPGSTAYEQFRAVLPEARAHVEKGEVQALSDLLRRYNFRSLDLQKHVQLQGSMVLESLDWLAAEHLH